MADQHLLGEGLVLCCQKRPRIRACVGKALLVQQRRDSGNVARLRLNPIAKVENNTLVRIESFQRI